MLCITTWQAGIKRHFVWHVGEKLPKNLNLGDVEEVYADMDELNYIRHKFFNLPITDNWWCEWVGDCAQFVARNIPRA